MFIQEEIEHILEAIQEKNDKPADHSKLFTESTSNNIMSLLFGQRMPAGDSARQLLDRVLELDAEALEITSLRNYFPSVAKFFAKFGVSGQSKDLHSTFAKFANLLKKKVKERKKVYRNEVSDILIDGAMEDITVNVYDVPKGTWIVPNLYAIHNDNRYWKEPENFIPERFLTDDGQLNASKIDSYLAFSYGKRNCPAETVAKITIFLHFAAIMQRFYVLPPVGKTPKLKAKSGIIYCPVQQELSFVTRE